VLSFSSVYIQLPFEKTWLPEFYKGGKTRAKWNPGSSELQCLWDKHIGSFRSKSTCSSIVLATWNSTLFGPMTLLWRKLNRIWGSLGLSGLNPFSYTQRLLRRSSTHFITCAPNLMFKMGKPTKGWCSDVFETGGTHSIVPVQLLKCSAVSLNATIGSESACCLSSYW